MPQNKTVCPISREFFAEHAETLMLQVGNTPVLVPVKEFSTGSLGWYANGKTVLEIGGQAVQVQMGLTFTIIGSKELPGTAPRIADAS